MPISAALGSSALLPGSLGFRNKLMNGGMVIAQRGTSAVTGSGSKQYPVDRWMVFNGTGTVTFQQSSTAPTGFSNSIVATVTATGSYGTTGYTQIGQYIEGYNIADLAFGTSGAKQIAISFWVRSSVTGTYNVAVQNGAQNRSYVTTFIVSTANTWEYKTIVVTGDTSGTWATDNTAGMALWVNLGLGSNFDTTANTWTAGSLYSTSGAVDFAANSGATFYLTGVQLEQNYQPTPFEQRPIGVELQLCQRYYQRYSYSSTGPAVFATGQFGGGTNSARMLLHLQVPMRSIPYGADFSAANTFWINKHNVANYTVFSIAHNSYGGNAINALEIGVSPVSTAGAAGDAAMLVAANTSAYIGVTAEL